MANRRTRGSIAFAMSAAGAQLANSTTATSLLHASGKGVIPAGALAVGKQLLVRASGAISCVVTTPGTLTLDLRLIDPNAAAVIVATSQAMALNVVAKTSVGWYLEWLLTARAIGAATAANLMHQGKFVSEAVVGSPLPSAGGAGCLSIPASTPAVGTGFDSTLAQTVDFFGKFSVATDPTNITCHQFSVASIG